MSWSTISFNLVAFADEVWLRLSQGLTSVMTQGKCNSPGQLGFGNRFPVDGIHTGDFTLHFTKTDIQKLK
jgi:hypothetical protein